MRKSFLLQAAIIQDVLMQKYRQNMIIFTTVFTATIMLATTVNIVSLATVGEKFITIYILLALMVTLISFAVLMLANKMIDNIRKRAFDVDFWHKKILEHELKTFKNGRVFTSFKLFQKSKIKNGEPSPYIIANNIDSVLNKDKQHVRSLFEGTYYKTIVSILTAVNIIQYFALLLAI
jgi:hypothetical protein